MCICAFVQRGGVVASVSTRVRSTDADCHRFESRLCHRVSCAANACTNTHYFEKLFWFSDHSPPCTLFKSHVMCICISGLYLAYLAYLVSLVLQFPEVENIYKGTGFPFLIISYPFEFDHSHRRQGPKASWIDTLLVVLRVMRTNPVPGSNTRGRRWRGKLLLE